MQCRKSAEKHEEEPAGEPEPQADSDGPPTSEEGEHAPKDLTDDESASSCEQEELPPLTSTLFFEKQRESKCAIHAPGLVVPKLLRAFSVVVRRGSCSYVPASVRAHVENKNGDTCALRP